MPVPAEFTLRPTTTQDQTWVRQFMIDHWGDEIMVTRGQMFRPHAFPGFVASMDDEQVGLITYRIAGDQCEVLSLDSLRPGLGLGSALLDAVAQAAAQAGCLRLWLITTNDNLHALGFYQKRGFSLAALYPNALAQSRRLKPSIPLIGMDGIPLRDELELERALAPEQ